MQTFNLEPAPDFRRIGRRAPLATAVAVAVMLASAPGFAQTAPPPPAYPPSGPAQPAPAPNQPPPPNSPPPPPNYPPPPPSAPVPPPAYQGYPPPNYSYLPPEAPRRGRSGFALGLGLGGGAVRAKDVGNNGLAFTFGVGGFLNRQVALMFDYYVISYDLDAITSEKHDVIGGAAQLYFADMLWIKAGLGLGSLKASQGGFQVDSTERALALTAGFGVEVLQTDGGFVLDLQLRLAGARYRGDVGSVVNTAILVGMNFY